MTAIRGSTGGRRAIVHIGAPRTGSTSFQAILDRHRGDLAAGGVLYPDLVPASATDRHINHQHLGETLDGRRPSAERRGLLSALDATLDRTRADTVLLSYERLCFLPRWRRVPATLAALFRRHGFAMEILYTVRPQAGAVQSHYTWRCQFLREGRSFGETFDGALRDRHLEPAVGLAPWLAAADGRATAVPLRDARTDEPLAARIFAALGLGDRVGALLTPDDLALRENGSLDAATIEVSRRLRRGGAVPPGNAEARRVVDVVEDLVGRSGLASPRFQGLDAAMVARADKRFARSNDRFAHRVWGEPWAARVAPDRPGPVTEIAGQDAPPSPWTEAVLDAIAAAARERFGLAAGRPPRDPWRAREAIRHLGRFRHL